MNSAHEYIFNTRSFYSTRNGLSSEVPYQTSEFFSTRITNRSWPKRSCFFQISILFNNINNTIAEIIKIIKCPSSNFTVLCDWSIFFFLRKFLNVFKGSPSFLILWNIMDGKKSQTSCLSHCSALRLFNDLISLVLIGFLNIYSPIIFSTLSECFKTGQIFDTRHLFLIYF